MQSGTGSGVAEAERWLTIAAKLLAARDLHGTRTFAIRARESDPRYEGSSQVLAVADTLLAGDSLVNDHPDWYAVLQLARLTQDTELIATQYRKLALLLNPVRNKLAFADQALKLVYDAWSVLSNPSKKSLYDNELQLSQLGQLGQLGQLSPQQRQPQTPVRRSPRNKDGSTAAEEDGPPPSFSEPIRPARQTRAAEAETRSSRASEAETRPIRTAEAETRPVPVGNADLEAPTSFWTACPYCFVLFEYPKVYEECTLRCQNCRRAFHAAVVPSPPAAGGKDAYFCSWGFFPLGFLGNAKGKVGSSNWSPISAMFTCPLPGDGTPVTNNRSTAPVAKRGIGRPRKNPNAGAARAYRDDPDVFIEISDPSDDSDDGDDDDDDDDDDEWQGGNARKKAKNGKGKGLVGESPKKVPIERKITRSSHNQNNVGGSAVQEGGVVVVHALRADANQNLAANSGKKKVAKEMGKLDLNVEFSNDVEEPAAPGTSEGNRAGNGEEDNMEGIGFFEGLDEFLSSLPILSVVGDDKVKAS